MSDDAPLGIFYEHPDWFKPLFAELDRRGTEYVRFTSDDHSSIQPNRRRAWPRSSIA